MRTGMTNRPRSGTSIDHDGPVVVPVSHNIILGAVGIGRANRGEANNKPQAKAGMILGIIGIVPRVRDRNADKKLYEPTLEASELGAGPKFDGLQGMPRRV